MSAENIEIMRRTFDAFNRHDTDSGRAVLAADVIWEIAVGAPGDGLYQGPDGVRQWFRAWTADFDDIRYEVNELTDAGDDVFAAVVAVARGRKSGLETRRQFFAAYTLRDGLIVRVRVFSDRLAALAAANLDPRPQQGHPVEASWKPERPGSDDE
jgi:ketosteroid isomerase-like protein